MDLYEESHTAKYDATEALGDDNHSEKTGSEGSEGFVKVDPDEPTELPSNVEEIPPAQPTVETISASSKQDDKRNHLESALYERLNYRVVDLVFWRDVKVSGFVFAFSLLILLALRCFSVIAVFAYFSLALLTVTISFRLYKIVLQTINGSQQPNPFQSLLDVDVSLTQQQVQRYTDAILGHINCTINAARDLVLVKNIAASVKFGLLMWLLTYVGGWFNGLTLVTLDVIFAFSLPPIYEKYQQPIDHYHDLVSNKISEVYKMVRSKIPVGGKQKTQ